MLATHSYAKNLTSVSHYIANFGFGRMDALKADIERVLSQFRDGGLLYCMTHFLQDHCSMEELVFAYDVIYEVVRRK